MKKWLNLFLTQFLGVLNDNLLKSLICFVSVLWMAEENRSDVISLASALMVLPFILFSPLAGKLARTHSKQKVVEKAKLLEIPIMIIAVVGFYFQLIWVVMLALFLMGLQSAIYSPSKYGLIRDIGGQKGLSYGAGTMDMLAFIGVLLGTILAGLISDFSHEVMISTIMVGLIGIAISGWLSSKHIRVMEEVADVEGNNTVNPLKFLFQSFKWSQSTKGLNVTVLGLATFWLVGSMLQMNLIVHCPEVLGLSNTETSVVIAFVAIGIGIGCWIAGIISRNRVELGLAPIGGIGLSICMTLLTIDGIPTKVFIALLMLGAFFSGLFKVPLTSWIQERVEGRKLGDILAYNNLLVFTFILLSAIIFGWVEKHLGSSQVFVVIAACAWCMTLVTLLKIPAMLARFVFYLLARTIYRIRVSGKDLIPGKTGALVVANHLSLLDGLIVTASIPRMVRFVIHRKIYEHKLFNWWCKRLNMIPIEGNSNPETLRKFNERCINEINSGHIVCIFGEGQIGRTGQINTFKKGIEHIAKGIKAPVYSLYMGNVVGSPFSYKIGTNSTYGIRPSHLKKRINILIGEELPKPLEAFKVRQRIVEHSADVFKERLDGKSLKQHLLDALNTNSNATQIVLEDGRPISKKQLLKDAQNGLLVNNNGQSEYGQIVKELSKVLAESQSDPEKDRAIICGVLGVRQTHDMESIQAFKSLHDVTELFGFVSKICWPI